MSYDYTGLLRVTPSSAFYCDYFLQEYSKSFTGSWTVSHYASRLARPYANVDTEALRGIVDTGYYAILVSAQRITDTRGICRNGRGGDAKQLINECQTAYTRVV